MLLNFYTSSTHSNHQESDLVTLCLATRSDIELLRKWKNAHAESFFHQGQISVAQQEEWFDGYLQRGDDYMFIASLNETVRFGCLGCRHVKGVGWDLYNIINGLSTTQRKGLMSVAMKQLLVFCQYRAPSPITLKVLSSNPARYWYEKNGFVNLEEHAGFMVMKYTSGNSNLTT
jgi:hypothetical protein